MPEISIIRLKRLVGAHYKTQTTELVRPRNRHEGRKVLVELSMRHLIGNGGIRELGERLNISGSAVAHMRRQIRYKIRDDADFHSRINTIEKEFLAKRKR